MLKKAQIGATSSLNLNLLSFLFLLKLGLFIKKQRARVFKNEWMRKK